MIASKYVNVVLTGDKNYVLPFGVLITSIAENLSKKCRLRVFLFVENFDDADKQQLNRLLSKYNFLELVYVDMKKYMHYFTNQDATTFKLKYISLATYFRLLLFKILPNDVEKCFYIDGDMIVNTDLYKLSTKLTKDKIAAVVMEVVAMSDRSQTLKHLTAISDFHLFNKNAYAAPYFNAGFLLINVKKAKKCKIFEKMMDFLKRYPNPVYADQDTLNAVIGQQYHDDIIFIGPEYNLFCNISYNNKFASSIYTEDVIKKAFKTPKICHYVGPEKPWKMKTKHFYYLWLKYAKKSPFYKQFKRKKQPFYEVIWFYVLGIPMFVYKHTNGRKKIYLFNLFNVFTVRYDVYKRSYFLFNMIPLFSNYATKEIKDETKRII